MSDSILVAFATASGSTQEVAEAIAAAIRETGVQVDCLPAREVRSLDAYRGVVLGAPLHMHRWHGDAMRFLSRHRAALSSRPVATFALGPFHDTEEEWTGVRAQLDAVLAGFPWLKPVAVQVFGGKFDATKLRFPYSLIPAKKLMPFSDIRDWVAIKAWGVSLVDRFGVQAG